MIEGKRLAINATYRQVSIIVFLVIAGMLIPSLMLPWGERSILRISTVAGLVIGFFPLSFQKNLSFLHMLLPCLLTMGAFFFEYVKQEDSFFLVLLLGIAGALLIAFLASMQRLESRTSGLLIWKWPRKRTIPFYEIEAVHLISKENEYSGIPSFDIRATLVTKQKVSLLPDGCDAFAVYYAAKIGLDRYKTQPSQKVE